MIMCIGRKNTQVVVCMRILNLKVLDSDLVVMIRGKMSGCIRI